MLMLLLYYERIKCLLNILLCYWIWRCMPKKSIGVKLLFFIKNFNFYQKQQFHSQKFLPKRVYARDFWHLCRLKRSNYTYC